MPKKIEGSSDNWRTPQELWSILNAQYKFTIDLCATKDDSKTPAYISNLEQTAIPENSISWMNPPFSKAKKLIPIALETGMVVGIYRADNLETSVWQDNILQKADWVFFFKGRVRYEDPFGTRQSPMFPSALWGRGVPPPVGVDGFCVRTR